MTRLQWERGRARLFSAIVKSNRLEWFMAQASSPDAHARGKRSKRFKTLFDEAIRLLDDLLPSSLIEEQA